MRLLTVATATFAFLILLPAAAHADPLFCADTGATHVGPHTIQGSKICLL